MSHIQCAIYETTTMEYEIQQSLPHKLILLFIASPTNIQTLFSKAVPSLHLWLAVLIFLHEKDTKSLENTQKSLAMKFNLSFCQFAAFMKRMRGKSLFSIMNVSLVWIDYFRNGCSIIHYRDRLMTHENVMESRVCVKTAHMHLL